MLRASFPAFSFHSCQFLGFTDMVNRSLYVRSGQAISSECILNRVSRLFPAPTQTPLVISLEGGGLWLLGWLLVRLLRLEVL